VRENIRVQDVEVGIKTQDYKIVLLLKGLYGSLQVHDKFVAWAGDGGIGTDEMGQMLSENRVI
jgi:hypothetical protein